MSASVASEKPFLSALQPHTSVTTYAIPSELQLGHKGSAVDEAARSRRVQQQVLMRMAERSSSSPYANGSSRYASTDYGTPTSMKYSTYSPAFSSKTQTISTNQNVPRLSQYSSRSMVESGQRGGGLNSFYQKGSATLPPAIMRLQSQVPPQGPAWSNQDFVNGNMGYESGATMQRHSVFGDAGFSAQVGQTSTMRSVQRSLSGTLIGGTGVSGGSGGGGGFEQTHQYSFKGPAYRTLTRMNRTPRSSAGTSLTQQVASGGTLQRYSAYSDGFSSPVGQISQGTPVLYQQQSGCSLHRSNSVKSMTSLAKGADIFDGPLEGVDATGRFTGINQLDMSTAVSYLTASDPELQVQGAAFIQHECYHTPEAKTQLRQLKGIPALVQLFNNNDLEVQRYATGAMRNAIYENMENKTALIDAGGITHLMDALKEPDRELQKNITGILWNLSSKDILKEKVARDALSQLTAKILVPLCSTEDSEAIQYSPSDMDILCNTTGCLRNLSSLNEKTRQRMRDTTGLVDSLVGYIQNSIYNGNVENKGLENSICVLRNLSYQMYNEMPPSTLQRLEGPSCSEDTNQNNPIGCFTTQGRKTKTMMNQDLSAFSEVAKQPKGGEWLWHPQVVALYNSVLQNCENNTTSCEAAAGALHNITGGDQRWASVLSRVALERERMLPILLDRLRTSSDQELRSLTGLLRNLTRHCRNKDDMATKLVNPLVTVLPSDGRQKEPSSEVVINICGALNNLVASSSVTARDITYFNGLQKLVAIKDSHDGSPAKLKASKAAATVLSNMFQYKKFHKDYKEKGFNRNDFAQMSI